jgi:hypothetical protein
MMDHCASKKAPMAHRSNVRRANPPEMRVHHTSTTVFMAATSTPCYRDTLFALTGGFNHLASVRILHV